jgi:hypothetical protein
MNQSIISIENRSKKLIPFLMKCYHIFNTIDFDYRRPFLNSFLIFDMAIDATGFRDKLQDTGYDIVSIKNDMQEIMSEDNFISICSGNELFNFAMMLDKIFFRDESPLKIAKADLPQRCNEFIKIIYESGPYSLTTYCHIFNLGEIHLDAADIFVDFTLETLTPYQLPILIGESSLFSALHPYEPISFFLTKINYESFTNEKLLTHLSETWRKAIFYIRPLQYLRDEPIYIDYVTIIFSPSWLNFVRREGILIFGKPLKPLQDYTYKLAPEIISSVKKWQNFYSIPEFYRLIDADYMKSQEAQGIKIPQMRKTLYLAGTYYEEYPTRDAIADKFLLLIFSLEALFSPQVESTFRTAWYASTLLAPPGVERNNLFKFIKKIFSDRADFVHGRKLFGELKIGDLEIRKLNSILRQSMLSFITAYLRGERSRDKFLKKLEELASGAEDYDSFKDNINLEIFIEEKLESLK